jgi:hypothetical protein
VEIGKGERRKEKVKSKKEKVKRIIEENNDEKDINQKH